MYARPRTDQARSSPCESDRPSRRRFTVGRMAPPPWTQLVHVHWPHSLDFLENRFALLRALQELDGFSAYRIPEAGVEARFQGWTYRLQVDAISVTLAIATSDPDESTRDSILRL